MMKMEQGATTAKLLGGDWSLDFANTWWEWDTSYTHLLEWSQRVGLVGEQKAQAMAQKAEASPGEAQDVLGHLAASAYPPHLLGIGSRTDSG